MRTPVIRRSSGSLSLLCLLLGGVSVLPAFGQDARLHIDHLEKLADKAAEVVDVTLDAPMLQLAAKFMSDKRSPEEARAREVVRDLKGIYVKSTSSAAAFSASSLNRRAQPALLKSEA